MEAELFVYVFSQYCFGIPQKMWKEYNTQNRFIESLVVLDSLLVNLQ